MQSLVVQLVSSQGSSKGTKKVSHRQEECVEPEATTSTDDEVSADENVSTPMPDAGAGVGSNTLSAEELRALKERLRAEATASLTQPSGEPSAGAPQVGTYNPMERQELNHLILNTDAVASEGHFELPFVNEEPEKVDPMGRNHSAAISWW